MKKYRSPLNIYVIWHPDFKAPKPEKSKDKKEVVGFGGQEYADFIYSAFSHNLENPLARGVGIPTYYRSAKKEDGTITPIAFHEAERNALVVLADTNMRKDHVFKEFVQNLTVDLDEKNRVFFFPMDERGVRVDPYQHKNLYEPLHFIQAKDASEEFSQRCRKMQEILAHDLCRMLLDQKPSYEVDGKEKSAPPIKLFISHARLDGVNQAEAIHEYVYKQSKLDSFLDTRRLYMGDNIEQALIDQMDIDTALVVIQTDEYSDRLWCQDELHQAKSKAIPMVVVNDLQEGEKRTFPYLGNVPSIKWKDNPQAVIDLALIQVLMVWYAKRCLEEIVAIYGMRNKYTCFTVGQAPELLDIAKMSRNASPRAVNMVLYPDPPLSRVETKILRSAQPNWIFTTPVSLGQYT